MITFSVLICISDSHDISISASNQSTDIVLLNLFLTNFNLEKARSGEALDTGRVIAILKAVYISGNTSFKPDEWQTWKMWLIVPLFIFSEF